MGQIVSQSAVNGGFSQKKQIGGTSLYNKPENQHVPLIDGFDEDPILSINHLEIVAGAFDARGRVKVIDWADGGKTLLVKKNRMSVWAV